jgi:hypothetical protein
MNKKLLIGGSSITVVVLVLASFNPVVGYASVESSAKDSPLFSVRTKRAIDQESEGLKCDYVGKDQGIDILFPTRDSNAVLFQRLIDKISRMNDVEFNRFIGLVINRLKKDNYLQDENLDEVVQILKKLRYNPIGFKNYYIEGKNIERTENVFCTTGEAWEPGCFIIFIFECIFIFTLTFFYFIVTLFFGDTYCVPFDTYCWCR